jgi:hypothetical protein
MNTQITHSSAAPTQPRHDIPEMDALDAQLPPGGKMPPQVEEQYKHIIEQNEQPRATLANRQIAMAGRLRLLEHYFRTNQHRKCVICLIEMMQKHPQFSHNSRVLTIASEVHAAEEQAFVTVYQRASSGIAQS